MTNTKGSFVETVEGIKNTVQSQIYVSTNTTLSKHNAKNFLTTIDFIKALDVDAFGCNSLIYSGKAPDASQKFALTTNELNQLLPQIRDKAQTLGLKFLWYTPVLGLGIKTCTAAMITACVAPNGDIYPCQSYFESLGNILTDPWEKIWHHPTAEKLRNRGYVEEKCRDCNQLQVCGGGCPLELQNKEHLCVGTR